MEANVIEVDMANYAIGSSTDILETKGVGSCIVVCLYDKKKKLGALAHIMLAHCTNETLNPFRFVDTGLPEVVRKLEELGIEKSDLEAHLVGGASMFVDIEDYLKLGEENISVAEDLLAKMGIPLISKEIGGNIGRSVRFILDTGEILVTTK